MTAAGSSARVAMARATAVQRADAQGAWLRGLGIVLAAVVLTTTLGGHPAPGVRGRALILSIALAVYLVTIVAIYARPDALSLVMALCAAGALLGGVQHSGANGVAPTAAIFIAVQRRPDRTGLGVAAATALLLIVLDATVLDSDGSTIAGNILLCALLAVVALLQQRSRADADRVELLLAELEDARDAEAQAAAANERARIAGDLHDVLAHSLSGAAIALEAARHIVRRDAPTAADPVERAARLVKDGLDDARDAVGALRGAAPGLDDVPRLLTDDSAQLQFAPVAVSPQAGVALYRGVQEALTNAARHAPGAPVSVVVTGGRVVIENQPATAAAPVSPGGGHGLAVMRERLGQAGGTADAGPTPHGGWRVVLEVPPLDGDTA